MAAHLPPGGARRRALSAPGWRRHPSGGDPRGARRRDVEMDDRRGMLANMESAEGATSAQARAALPPRDGRVTRCRAPSGSLTQRCPPSSRFRTALRAMTPRAVRGRAPDGEAGRGGQASWSLKVESVTAHRACRRGRDMFPLRRGKSHGVREGAVAQSREMHRPRRNQLYTSRGWSTCGTARRRRLVHRHHPRGWRRTRWPSGVRRSCRQRRF